jgi:hypothetical protein
VQRFVSEDKIGRDHFAQGNIGLINGKLVYMRISAKAAGGLYDPYYLKNPVKERWDDLVNNFNKYAS